MRIGQGYDVHRLVEGRDLIIGGVKIDFDLGLEGHSDADVLTHAVMDALLGACGLGDIGQWFPDTDQRFKGANSVKLLEEVGNILEENNYAIENIDCTIICQRPKLAPYKDEMKKIMANALGIDEDRINIKATTEEGLGFTGKLEGISASAICLIDKIYDFRKISCGGCCGCSR